MAPDGLLPPYPRERKALPRQDPLYVQVERGADADIPEPVSREFACEWHFSGFDYTSNWI